MEEDQGESPRLVRTIDLGGAAPVGGGLVVIDAHGQRRRGAGRGFGDLRRVAPVDQTGGQMPEQMHHERPGQTLISRSGAGADSGQHRRRREERVEDCRAHDVGTLSGRYASANRGVGRGGGDVPFAFSGLM